MFNFWGRFSYSTGWPLNQDEAEDTLNSWSFWLPLTCWGHIYTYMCVNTVASLTHPLTLVCWEGNTHTTVRLSITYLYLLSHLVALTHLFYRKLSPEPRFKNVLKSLTPSIFLLWIKGGLTLAPELQNAGKALYMVKTSLCNNWEWLEAEGFGVGRRLRWIPSTDFKSQAMTPVLETGGSLEPAGHVQLHKNLSHQRYSIYVVSHIFALTLAAMDRLCNFFPWGTG